MLNYAITFFVIAIVAALLGFSGIAGSAASIAKILFLVFLVLAVFSFFTGRRHNRRTIRDVHSLRGNWRLEQGAWAQAAASFSKAVAMAREVRRVDEASETGLALAKVHLNHLTGDEARGEAQRLAQLRCFADRRLANRCLSRLWQALGDLNQAKHHSLAAYTLSWADGEPYVYRYELTKATELLHELVVPLPNLPPYDPAKDEPFPWEADLRAFIAKCRAEQAAKEKAKQHGEVKTIEFLSGELGMEDSK